MISKSSQISGKTQAYEFGGFIFDLQNKVLFKDEETITLPPKACELLGVLIENAGRVVSRDELLGQVWAETFVEEANLTHHISALRKALGENKNGKRFIETIPRKGYRFVPPVENFREMENSTTEFTVSERVITNLTEEAEISYQPFPKLPSASQPSADWFALNKSRIAVGLLLVTGFMLAFYGFVWRYGASDLTQEDGSGNRMGKIPSVIKQCEGGICGTWTLADGNQFNAVWDNDARATLTVEQFDNNQVVFTRHDTGTSVSRSLSAIYVGRLSGNKITDGKVTWTADGQSWSGSWSANW